MKRLLILCFIFSTCFSTYSQNRSYKSRPPLNNHTGGDIVLSMSPTILFQTPYGPQLAGGAKVQLFVSKRFSLDADLMGSRDYVHFSPGLIGVPLGILGLATGEEAEHPLVNLLVSLAAIALSIEHVSYHLPVTPNLDISPYVSLLRIKYAYGYGNYSDPEHIGEHLCFATGVQINSYIGRFSLSPYAEYGIGYSDKRTSFNAGLYFGLYLPTK